MTDDPRPSEVQALAEKVSDALAATTEGADYTEAPEPSDEPGSPYVMRLTHELHARGVRAPSPTEDPVTCASCLRVVPEVDAEEGICRECFATFHGVAPSPDAPGLRDRVAAALATTGLAFDGIDIDRVTAALAAPESHPTKEPTE